MPEFGNTVIQVYDITLLAALKLQKCGPSKLVVEGEWKWLLGMFAATYGVCQSYTTLAHLRWVVRYATGSLQSITSHIEVPLAVFAGSCRCPCALTVDSTHCERYVSSIAACASLMRQSQGFCSFITAILGGNALAPGPSAKEQCAGQRMLL